MVLMHGRSGPYSTAAKGVYDATTLSQRHQMWGRIWAERGTVALLADSFGPRGYPQGFPRFSYDARPDAVNEVSVRPFDAYGALAFLRTRLMPGMVPARLIEVPGALPVTGNGKLDTAALPGIDFSAGRPAHRAPRNRLEARLCQLWGELLPVSAIGIEDGQDATLFLSR